MKMMINMLSIDDFELISLDDRALFDRHNKKYPPVHIDYIFTTLISWVEYCKYKYALIKNNIIIMSNIKNQIQFRPPWGKKIKDLFDQVLILEKKTGFKLPFCIY